jgi:8-amino-7-oxononanoate synthase
MTPTESDDWLARSADDRERAGLRRRLLPRQPGEHLIDLAGNDYLGLSRDPRVIAAAVDALHQWGAGATGSRLVTGSTQLHSALEQALATFTGAESALVFSSGYCANVGALAALAGPEVVVVSDAGNHASIVDACRLSRSRIVVTPHNDVSAVAETLAAREEPRAVVVTDAVFSTDGDLAPLVELHAVSQRYGALLLVDEAHALGVVGTDGRGACADAGIAAEPDVVRTVTLSKSLGSQGGAVLGTALVVEHLINTARTFIFDTGLSPASAGAALRSLQLLADDPRLPEQVRHNSAALSAAVGAPAPAAAVVSLVLKQPLVAVAVAERCRREGVLVGCFRPPSVPVGTSRLRLTARADLSSDDLKQAAKVIVAAVEELA